VLRVTVHGNVSIQNPRDFVHGLRSFVLGRKSLTLDGSLTTAQVCTAVINLTILGSGNGEVDREGKEGINRGLA
jgi:hypothetical protein